MPVLALTNFSTVASLSVLAIIWQWYLPVIKSCHIVATYASFGTDQFFHSGFSVSFSYYMAMTLSLLKSSHITAGYASFDTDQYHGTGMPVSFSYYLTLTSPMGRDMTYNGFFVL